MSENLSEISYSHKELVVKKNSASNSQMSDTNFTSKPEAINNNTVESPDLESYAKKISFNFANNEDDLRKFYDFTGSDFIWPSTMTEYDRHDIFYYITDPEWDPVGEEFAINTIAYYHLIESEAFRDKLKGIHVLIVHGKVLNYYEKDVLWEEYEELEKKYPEKYFAPITEKTVLLRRFSTNNDTIRKEWQVNIYIRSTINILNETRIASIDNRFRMVIDMRASMTTIPFFLRQRLQSF
ncbi:10941_t:CDS:2, partial [Rhizophagus irregularis]